jgi:hypothetical protein
MTDILAVVFLVECAMDRGQFSSKKRMTGLCIETGCNSEPMIWPGWFAAQTRGWRWLFGVCLGDEPFVEFTVATTMYSVRMYSFPSG